MPSWFAVKGSQDSGSDDLSATRNADAIPWVVALFVAGLVVRLVHLWTVRESPFFSLLILDPAMYDEWARALANGEWRGGVFFHDPLYAYLLAALYSVTGPSQTAVAILQSVLGASVAPLVFLAARSSFDRRTSVLAGALAAFYLPAIYYDGLLLKTSLGLFWVALLLALLAQAPGKRPLPRFLVAGVVLGLGALTRGNLRLIIPVVVLWIVLETPFPGSSSADWRVRWREPARRTAVIAFLVGAALVLVPTAVRNRVVGGEWVLTTANVGQNLYLGNNPLNDTGEYPRLPFVDPNPKYEQRDFAAEAARRLGHDVGVREASRFWQAEALRWMRGQPTDWLRLSWLKLRTYWGAFEVPDSLDYYLYRQWAPVLRLPLPGFGLLAPFGLLGAGLVWRRRGWPRLLLWFVCCYSVSVILFFVFSRFRMAMLPALYVLAAYGAVESVRAVATAVSDRRRRGRAVLLVGVWLALAAFVNLPVRARAESTLAGISRALGLPLRVETSATARFNLGVAYAARASDRPDSERWLVLAEEQLRRARQAETRHASIPIELGKVLARQGRNREAVEVYRDALVLEPRNYRIHHALGLLAERMADETAAEAAFRRALEVEPRHTASAIHLGESLLRQGRAAEAEQVFAHALRLSPDHSRARRGQDRARQERTGVNVP